MKKLQDTLRNIFFPALLNSYSVVFFFNNKLMGIILMAVTFLNFWAGLSGLLAVVVSLMIAGSMGFDDIRLKQGIFSFNALLTGIGMGTFFEPGIAFFVLLLLAVLFSLILSVTLGGWLGKYGLPFLSIPFVFSFWLILLPSSNLSNLGLTQRNVFWMNEMYSLGGKPLLDLFQTIDNLPLNRILTVYLRSLSSIIFQDNLFTGILIAVAILISSRITFLLSVTGFLAAVGFSHIAGTDMAGMSFYNIGANYILVAIAAGGFFVIPSWNSFLWVIILVPLTSLLILFLNKLVPIFGQPFFSLPFSLIVIIFIYFLLQRTRHGKIFLTPFQYYSPEVNLYSFRGNVDRNTGITFIPLHLPFWGEWTVSQGYEGEYTHKGEWSKAIDFVLADESGNTHAGQSSSCEDYFCYNKPVLAPAGGTVADIIDHIDDNEPGKVNSAQNWGNTIIIKHYDNLYTQLSHIKPGTFRVKKGDYVRQGDVVGLCGNSGRSPQPHLHFQVQSVPLPGAKPFEYPISYYFLKSGKDMKLMSFKIPSQGDRVSDVVTSYLYREAFDLQPGKILKFRYRIDASSEQEVTWEIFTDAWNNRYIYCKVSRSYAYFVNDGTMFYFTSFNGSRKSLLYFFYLASYKILLGYYGNIIVDDLIPLHMVVRNRLSLWLHDFISPFHQFIKAKYIVRSEWSDSPVNPGKARLISDIRMSWFFSMKDEGTGSILLSDNQITEFSFESVKHKVWAGRKDI
jgi:urea transporter/murein DD-endopeptidase MepM/ murein hydrolase activator NlpD